MWGFGWGRKKLMCENLKSRNLKLGQRSEPFLYERQPVTGEEIDVCKIVSTTDTTN
jgi:hypothetical protein